MDRLSSELLGCAPDGRVLIVNCDDFGMHDAVNAAVVESIENGIARSCSLMVPCPAAANAMRLLRERPHISFGIHLALIRDKREYRWGPAAAKADVSSLLHPDTNELYVDTPAERTAPKNCRRSSQLAGKSGTPTPRSSPHHEHARSSIRKASALSTTGYCKRRGTRSRVSVGVAWASGRE